MKNLYRICGLVSVLASVLLVFIPVARAQIYENPYIQPQIPPYVIDEVLVKFQPDAEDSAILDLIARLGCRIADDSSRTGACRVSIPKGMNVPEMVKEFGKSDLVEYAEPDRYVHTLMSPNDPFFSPYQWNLTGLYLKEAWDIQTGDPSVVVAIIDTGVAYENYSVSRGDSVWKYLQAPDLGNTRFVEGYDFVEDDAHPNDDNGHGTHVAGTIAQSTNNRAGVAGVAFNCSIMPVKVLDADGSGTHSAIAEGIAWATDHGAKVINLSLGGASGSNTMESALRYAYSRGVTVVAAAGNDGIPFVSYPAAYDEYVIAVGAVRYDNNLTQYSCYGPSLDLVAPGGDMGVDQNGDQYGDGILQNTFNPSTRDTGDFGYWFFEGTSMASPHIAGVAALLYSQKADIQPGEVRNLLQSTARDLGNPGRDNRYGYGLVNALAALRKMQDNPDTEPLPVAFTVSQNIPNPFNQRTTIAFTMFQEGEMTLEIFNSAGQKVDTLLSGNMAAGEHRVIWDAERYATGAYFYRAKCGNLIKSMKMMYLR